MARARRTHDALRCAPSKSAAKSLLIDSLETRQHLAADVNLAINFQPASSPRVAGWLVDSGQTFRSQNGYQYGWSMNQTHSVRDRNVNSDQLKDTLILNGASKWEAAVPNGRYTVSLTSGDASWLDSHYSYTVEGKTLLNGLPTASDRWVTGTTTVDVTDGRLTIANGPGFYNNKVSFLTIKSATTTGSGNTTAKPAAPSNLQHDGVSTKAVNLVWKDNSNNEQGFYVQQSSDGVNWVWVGTNSTANDNTITISGLQASKTYKFRAIAFNAAGDSAASTVLTVTTPGTTTTPPPVVTAPAAPTGLAAAAVTHTGLTLNWTDKATNETAYYVEQSSNGGSSWTRVKTLAANDKSEAITGLSAKTAYKFRVAASNSAGTSYSAILSVTTAAAPSTGGGNTSGGNATDGVLGAYANKFAGVNANINESAPSGWASEFKELGIKRVRTWWEIKNWSSGPSSASLAWVASQAKAWSDLGFEVMMTVNLRTAPSNPADAERIFNTLASSEAAQYVDLWQIGNEVNHPLGFNGSFSSYINNVLAPASRAFWGKGLHKVVGSGPTWDIKAVSQLVSLGYTKYCDYAAFHPYAGDANQVISRVMGAVDALNGKPLILTEWNLDGFQSLESRGAQLTQVAKAIGPYIHSAYFFGTQSYSDGKGIGRGALFNGRARNTAIWNTFESWIDEN